MNLEWDDTAARGLRRYVRQVAEAVGLGIESSLVQLDEPVCAYLALDRWWPGCPDNDLALVWDEQHGWALALEQPGDAQLTPLGCLDAGLLPEPRVVADYVDAACAGAGFGPAEPASTDAARDLAGRLAMYADQMVIVPPDVTVSRAVVDPPCPTPSRAVTESVPPP